MEFQAFSFLLEIALALAAVWFVRRRPQPAQKPLRPSEIIALWIGAACAWDRLFAARHMLQTFDPITISILIGIGLGVLSAGVNYLLTPKPGPITRGKQEGELNIQNSQSGAFIPEIFGGDVSEFVGSGDDDDTHTVVIDPDGNVVVTTGSGTTVATIGLAYSWFEAADIAWASNGSEINCIYNYLEPVGHNLNANATALWPGKGRYFKKLVGDIEAGNNYFIAVPPQVPSVTAYYEGVVNSFPQFKTSMVNGKPAVAFSGDEAHCAQLNGFSNSGTYEPGGLRGESPFTFSASSRLTIFLLARHAPGTSTTGTFLSLCGENTYTEGERGRVSLIYYGDIDAFGFSFDDQNGDVRGVSGASDWVNDWFLVTAIVSPSGDGIAARLRVNGVEQTVSQVRAPSSLSGTAHSLSYPRALILGAQTTVKQSSKDDFNAIAPASTVYSNSRNLHGDIAECIIAHNTSELSNTNLALVEAALMAKYGLNV